MGVFALGASLLCATALARQATPVQRPPQQGGSAANGTMGGGGMMGPGMMMGCGPMMGGPRPEVIVEETKGGVIVRMKAAEPGQVEMLRRMARMMATCMGAAQSAPPRR